MEDTLLRRLQNSHLDDDDDDKRKSESETDNDDNDTEGEEDSLAFSPQQQYHQQLNSRVSGPQTGPKGVIADHKYYKQQQLADKSKAYADYNAHMRAKALTTTTYLQDLQQQEELVLEHKPSPLSGAKNLIYDEDDQLEGDDDTFLKDYRQKRLLELKRLQERNHALRQQQKRFGQLKTIAADDYADEVDNEWKSVPVIIHLFDSSLPKCKELDTILTDLSKKYRLAKFLRVSAQDLDFDLVGSPAILAYKGGILVANLVRLVDQCSATSRFDIDSIEEVLLRNGALSEHDLYELPTHLNKEEEDDY
ncbi:thioredoxin-like protein [Mycotypha africana]|uniref:thioredoxin-like protein n=1 Tax=Mycotypha africana TaxID=64632 RepID=UPI0022FFD153|nr:thioredoxin-like protein [Mycotypha africana]KAI8969180.1 thioredoxin-like protein [Mycotypha africana]